MGPLERAVAGKALHAKRKEVDPELLARVEALGASLRPTPVVRLAHPRLHLFAKLEYHSVVGSLKDRPAYYMLRDAIRRGEIRRTTTVIESSSGNTGSALAVFCRLLGLTFVPVVDPNIQNHYRGLLESTCTRVVRVDTRDETGGYLKTRLAKVQELLETIGDAYWTDQYRNPSAMSAHHELTAGEIIASFPALDYVFVGVSTAGTIAGVSRRLKAHFPDVRIVAVDAEGSAIFGQTPRCRYIPGIGSSIVPDLLRHALIDDTVHVRELDTIAACHDLVREHQILAGGSSGSSYAAIQSYPFPEPSPTVLFLCADRGTAYMDTVYDERWVAWRREREEASPAPADAQPDVHGRGPRGAVVNTAGAPTFSIVGGKSVHAIVFGDIAGCMEVVRAAYLAHGAGRSVNPNSYFLRFPERPTARIIALPAYLGDAFDVAGIKWISSFPENVAKGIPRASAVLVLNDCATGYPFACLEASIISAARTAASAVLAAKACAAGRSQPRTLGIVGNGLIARYLYEFFVRTGWSFPNVRLFDATPGESRRFSERLTLDARHAVAHDEAIEPLLRASDLIVFATTAGAPYVHDIGLFTHNPIVLNISLRDLGTDVILGSYNVVDDVGHVLNANTSPHLAEQRVGHRGFIHATIPQLLAGDRQPATDRPVVVSPFGLGVLDLAVGNWVYARAEARGELVEVPDFFWELTR